MSTYKLIYMEANNPAAKPWTTTSLIVPNCWDSRDKLEKRLRKGYLSQGDLESAGVHMRRTDIKSLLLASRALRNKPVLTYHAGALRFQSQPPYPHQRFSIKVEALGLKPHQHTLHDGDQVSIDGVDKMRGDVPHFNLLNKIITRGNTMKKDKLSPNKNQRGHYLYNLLNTGAYKGSEITRGLVKKEIENRWGAEAASQYDPTTNCFTYKTWQQKGYQVKRGEKAIKSITYLTSEKIDKQTREKVDTVTARRFVNLFYISQVEKLEHAITA